MKKYLKEGIEQELPFCRFKSGCAGTKKIIFFIFIFQATKCVKQRKRKKKNSLMINTPTGNRRRLKAIRNNYSLRYNIKSSF